MSKGLTIKSLIKEAKLFCKLNSGVYRPELFGVTDGKAIGTFVEHLFQQHLAERYDIQPGNSASGLDLPSVNTDIKVTSSRQPQSSCPIRTVNRKFLVWDTIFSYLYMTNTMIPRQKQVSWILYHAVS